MTKTSTRKILRPRLATYRVFAIYRGTNPACLMKDTSTFFRDITLAISSSLDVNIALKAMLGELQNWMPVDEIHLNYFNEETCKITPVGSAISDTCKIPHEFRLKPITVGEDFIQQMERQINSTNPLLVTNRPEEIPAVLKKYFPASEHNSNMVLSLIFDGETLGVLIVTAQGHNRYTNEHTQLIQTVKEPIGIAMSNARRYMDLKQIRDRLDEDNKALSADLTRLSGSEVIGAEFGLREVMKMVRRISNSNSPALLLGETGTGKEVIANAIHVASRRNQAPLIQMQCGAIPETLLDSELFGHEKGAFTGAFERKRGRFERADGGTLFLDEVGELSADAQVKLLRVLQEQTFERIGGTETIKVDVRVIAATHRDLEQMVADGRFREDLWYRLNVLPIRIPPLRLRKEDIPKLAQYFINRKSEEMNLEQVPNLGQDSLDRLQEYNWPGNVRELNNIIERALILSHGPRLSIPTLGLQKSSHTEKTSQQTQGLRTLDQTIADQIRITLEHTRGKLSGSGGAAEILDMKESTLRFRMKKLGIER